MDQQEDDNNSNIVARGASAAGTQMGSGSDEAAGSDEEGICLRSIGQQLIMCEQLYDQLCKHDFDELNLAKPSLSTKLLDLPVPEVIDWPKTEVKKKRVADWFEIVDELEDSSDEEEEDEEPNEPDEVVVSMREQILSLTKDSARQLVSDLQERLCAQISPKIAEHRL